MPTVTTADSKGELVILQLTAETFLPIYAAALNHKATQMAIGGQRKAAVAAAQTVEDEGYLMPSYLHNLLVACDQLVNAAIGGWPDETLSSRCWRWHKKWRALLAMPLLDKMAAWLGDRDHCRTSYESERTRRQLPPELRGAL